MKNQIDFKLGLDAAFAETVFRNRTYKETSTSTTFVPPNTLNYDPQEAFPLLLESKLGKIFEIGGDNDEKRWTIRLDRMIFTRKNDLNQSLSLFYSSTSMSRLRSIVCVALWRFWVQLDKLGVVVGILFPSDLVLHLQTSSSPSPSPSSPLFSEAIITFHTRSSTRILAQNALELNLRGIYWFHFTTYAELAPWLDYLPLSVIEALVVGQYTYIAPPDENAAGFYLKVDAFNPRAADLWSILSLCRLWGLRFRLHDLTFQNLSKTLQGYWLVWGPLSTLELKPRRRPRYLAGPPAGSPPQSIFPMNSAAGQWLRRTCFKLRDRAFAAIGISVAEAKTTETVNSLLRKLVVDGPKWSSNDDNIWNLSNQFIKILLADDEVPLLPESPTTPLLFPKPYKHENFSFDEAKQRQDTQQVLEFEKGFLKSIIETLFQPFLERDSKASSSWYRLRALCVTNVSLSYLRSLLKQLYFNLARYQTYLVEIKAATEQDDVFQVIQTIGWRGRLFLCISLYLTWLWVAPEPALDPQHKILFQAVENQLVRFVTEANAKLNRRDDSLKAIKTVLINFYYFSSFMEGISEGDVIQQPSLRSTPFSFFTFKPPLSNVQIDDKEDIQTAIATQVRAATAAEQLISLDEEPPIIEEEEEKKQFLAIININYHLDTERNRLEQTIQWNEGRNRPNYVRSEEEEQQQQWSYPGRILVWLKLLAQQQQKNKKYFGWSQVRRYRFERTSNLTKVITQYMPPFPKCSYRGAFLELFTFGESDIVNIPAVKNILGSQKATLAQIRGLVLNLLVDVAYGLYALQQNYFIYNQVLVLNPFSVMVCRREDSSSKKPNPKLKPQLFAVLSDFGRVTISGDQRWTGTTTNRQNNNIERNTFDWDREQLLSLIVRTLYPSIWGKFASLDSRQVGFLDFISQERIKDLIGEAKGGIYHLTKKESKLFINTIQQLNLEDWLDEVKTVFARESAVQKRDRKQFRPAKLFLKHEQVPNLLIQARFLPKPEPEDINIAMQEFVAQLSKQLNATNNPLFLGVLFLFYLQVKQKSNLFQPFFNFAKELLFDDDIKDDEKLNSDSFYQTLYESDSWIISPYLVFPLIGVLFDNVGAATNQAVFSMFQILRRNFLVLWKQREDEKQSGGFKGDFWKIMKRSIQEVKVKEFSFPVMITPGFVFYPTTLPSLTLILDLNVFGNSLNFNRLQTEIRESFLPRLLKSKHKQKKECDTGTSIKFLLPASGTLLDWWNTTIFTPYLQPLLPLARPRFDQTFYFFPVHPRLEDISLCDIKMSVSEREGDGDAVIIPYDSDFISYLQPPPAAAPQSEIKRAFAKRLAIQEPNSILRGFVHENTEKTETMYISNISTTDEAGLLYIDFLYYNYQQKQPPFLDRILVPVGTTLIVRSLDASTPIIMRWMALQKPCFIHVLRTYRDSSE